MEFVRDEKMENPRLNLTYFSELPTNEILSDRQLKIALFFYFPAGVRSLLCCSEPTVENCERSLFVFLGPLSRTEILPVISVVLDLVSALS